MSDLMSQLRETPLFRAALIVPTVIILVFSGFNLTAAPDASRAAAAMKVGIVNLDEGQVFPPIKVSERLMQGLGQQMPFSVIQYNDEPAAIAALEGGEVAAYILFPPEFSRQAFGDEPVGLSVVGAGNATMAEANIARQLPAMLEMGLAAGVNGLRLAMAKGQMPTGGLPVSMEAVQLHAPANPAAGMAGFAASYTIWLSTMVGGLLLFIATRGAGEARPLSVVRTVVPVVASGLATLILTTMLSLTSGLEAGFVGFWLMSWAIALSLAWLFAGLFAGFGFFALIVALPMVFYQGALGGTQIPATAAPDWLDALSLGLPFDHLGALLRSMILGGTTTPDWTLFAMTGALGLLLIWGGTRVWTRYGGNGDG